MKMKILFLIIGIIILGCFFVSAQSLSSSVVNTPRASFQAVYGPEGRIDTYWPILGDKEQCLARQDLLLQISPGGCTPSVVRSDLLAEQNVPVFCQIDALQINPLIDIDQIRSISFTGKYPGEIVGAGFHPARAALRSRDKLLGSPLINNIGYIVVILKKNEIEKNLPDFVNVTLTARIDYEAGNAFGVGKAEFILEPSNDEQWEDVKFKQSFWNGRYFVRLEEAEPEFAIVSLYNGDRKIATTRVDRGQTSGPVFVPGSYCRAGVRVAYDGFIGNRDRALIEVSDQEGTDRIDAYQGSRFLNDRCSIERVQIYENDLTHRSGEIAVRCNSARVVLKLDRKENSSLRSETANAKVDEAINALELVASDYPAEREKDVEGSQLYGELALQKAINLAAQAGKHETMKRLMQRVVIEYPGSSLAGNYRYELLREDVDFSNSYGVLNVDNKFYNIRLVDVRRPEKASFASFSISGVGAGTENVNIKLEELMNFTGEVGTLDSLRVDRIESQDRVSVTANCRAGSTGGQYSLSSKSFTLSLLNSDATQVCEKSFIRLRNINIEEAAKIRLIPESQGTRIETNLTVNIGIEKRAIKLSPKKTAELIENLNKSVERWENINDKLGNVVEGLKGACFATSAFLTVSNFIDGVGGEAIARSKVMQGENGWSVRCSEMVGKGQYVSLDSCYLENSNDIERDVSEAQKVINDINTRIDAIEAPLVEGTNLGGIFESDKSVDRSKAAVAYCEEMVKSYGTEKVKTIEGEKSLNDMIGGDCAKAYQDGVFGYSELRDIELNLRLKKQSISPNIQDNLKLDLEGAYNNILRNQRRSSEIEGAKAARAQGIPSPGVVTALSRSRVVAEVLPKAGLTNADLKSKVSSEFVASAVVDASKREKTADDPKTGFEGGTYILGLNKDDEGYNIAEVLSQDKTSGEYTKLPDERRIEFGDIYRISKITSAETKSYVNPYENPLVRYYETEPYKGMPAIVPFDIREGWYAGTKQTLPSLGGTGSFDASGRVTSFYLCNVGQNKKEQFLEGLGDDICQLINLNTGQPLGFFPGLEEREARQKVSQAVQAIQDAANQYGKKIIRINGRDFQVGSPAANIPSLQCQNFMSPKECWTLFNVCDPVICPPSRCDFGGKYPVADVVQTGIVGSTLLCLPNIQEKIIIPVCLTGIHAGIDGYLSIMKSYRDCLQESLDTGRTVGICDQIHSIYLCEFFWRQVAPIAKIILPKIVETAYGQGTRGGGEYLSVMAAWQNMQDSITYFTQSYAVNSIKAFQVRSVEEAGTPFCKAFVSAKAPTNIEALVEPDSPPQFHAWFSATGYTDATVPATSQYKVFYHIFAGKDQGIHYSVYMRNPPENSYFTLPAVIQVASGFVGRGQYSSETRDFTAPEGYKELCVRVNDKEECGFGQVSTSFALNYLSDSYAAGQAKQSDVKSEAECISGTSVLKDPRAVGAIATTGGNLQAGAEGAVLPAIYNRGLVRICSSQNPGSQTQPERFIEVGYCDDQKIKCWLDKQSVKNAISDNNKGVLNSTLAELGTIQNAELNKIRLDSDDINARIKEINREIARIKDDNSVVNVQDVENLKNKINVLFEGAVYNHHKAAILYANASLLAAVAEKEIKNVKVGSNGVSAGTSGNQQGTPVVAQDYSKILTLHLIKSLVKTGSVKEIDFRWNYKDNKPEAELIVDSSFRTGFQSSLSGVISEGYYARLSSGDIPALELVLNSKTKEEFSKNVLDFMKIGRFSIDGNVGTSDKWSLEQVNGALY